MSIHAMPATAASRVRMPSIRAAPMKSMEAM